MFYDNPHNTTNPKLKYEYLAENLIKTNKDKQTGSNDTNSFIWKIVNQNLIKVIEKTNIEVYFNITHIRFLSKKVKYSVKVSNTTSPSPVTAWEPAWRINLSKQNITALNVNNYTNSSNSTGEAFNNYYDIKYIWKGELNLREVVIIELNFPMVFEKCGNISINLFIVGLGALFIILLIGMLFMIFSSLFFEEV